MACCRSCVEFCCPCLLNTKQEGSSEYAHIHYTRITKPSSSERPAKQASELTPGADSVHMFGFPQEKPELAVHPQMFVDSSREVVTEQPVSKPPVHHIGRRRFSTHRTGSSYLEHVARRTQSLPAEASTQKQRRKTTSMILSKTLPRLGKKKSRPPLVRTGSGPIEELDGGGGEGVEGTTGATSRARAGGKSLPDLREGLSVDTATFSALKRPRRKTVGAISDTDIARWIPGLPVLEETTLTEDTTHPLLQFGLRYDVLKCTLTVHLHHACNLPAKDRRGTSDPFVVVYVMPNRENIFESKVVSQSLNPVFGESFEFDRLTADDIRRQTLIFRIYDHKKFSKNNTIGSIMLPLETADLFGVVMRMEIDENPELFNDDSQGDLLLAVSYNLPLSRLKGVLLKATNLKKQDVIGLADPYVKIRLYYKDKLIEKWKSSIKRRTLVPVFNESFQFDISGEMDIKDIVMKMLVMDFDRFSKDDVVGEVVLGSKVEGEAGRRHWQDMVSFSPQVMSQWHSIKKI